MTKAQRMVNKAQRIANETGRDQVVINSCYGYDIADVETVFPGGKSYMLLGCEWVIVKVAA